MNIEASSQLGALFSPQDHGDLRLSQAATHLWCCRDSLPTCFHIATKMIKTKPIRIHGKNGKQFNKIMNQLWKLEQMVCHF